MSELLNLIGLSTGVVLYAMLLIMVVRAGRAPGAPRFDPLLFATAVLGLIWNLCALPAYELPKVGIEGPFTLLIAAGFSALGFLPAVVVQSVLRGERDRVRGWPALTIAFVAYGVSGVAAALHAHAAWIGEPLPSAVGMRLLTYTFIALVVPLAAVTRGQRGARRALWAAALSVFAVSAMHLSQFHQGDASWPVELLGHHASLPLAFAILYQDFPFALADLFLKRALTLVALVAAAFIAIAGVRGLPSAAAPPSEVRDIGLLVTLWVATALLYPRLRALASWFVDAVVLDRPDYALLRARIARRARNQDDIGPLLDEACAELAPALSARSVEWREVAEPDRAQMRRNVALAGSIAAIVDVPVAEPPHYSLEVAGLIGGRRLLSDDVAALEAIASGLGRRIDAIRLAHERYNRELREQEIAKLASEAELRALRSQINPHFLFNALTTIGYLIQTAPPRALQTLLRLTSLLRGVLRSEGEFTTLGREVDIIEAYLDIERARFEQRLRVTIDVPARLRSVRLPALVLQPLVENAVKHGVAPQTSGGDVSIHARVDPWQPGARQLTVTIRDTGAGVSAEQLQHGREEGVGLRNVERRLQGQYGADASLSIESAPGRGTTVEVRLPVTSSSSEMAPDRVAV